MKGKIVHIEIPAEDTQRAMKFWGGLTGWKFQNYAESTEGAPEYNMFEGEPGGGLYPATDGEKGIKVYFETDDIDAELGRIRDAGGNDRGEDAGAEHGLVRGGHRHRGQQVLRLAVRRERTGARGHGRTVRVLLAEESRRIEEVELGLAAPEHGLSDELAAREAEHVAVARVAGCDPHAVATGDRAGERQVVFRHAEDPGPAVRDRAEARRVVPQRRRSARPGSAR